jgi:hypothetical protein
VRRESWTPFEAAEYAVRRYFLLYTQFVVASTTATRWPGQPSVHCEAGSGLLVGAKGKAGAPIVEGPGARIDAAARTGRHG